MKRPARILPLGSLVLIVALAGERPARAGLMFYSTRSSFDTAAPNLPTETFAEATFVQGATFYTFPGSLNSSTRNAAFQSGATQSGITFGSVTTDSGGIPSGGAGSGLVVTANGTIPNATQSLGTLNYNNAMEITLASANAIALNLFASPGPSLVVPANFLVEVFGANGLLGTQTVASPGVGGFFGVTSTELITKVDVVAQGSTVNTFVDNVSFGNASARSVFLATHPGLSTEGFEAARVADGQGQLIAGPLNYRSNNGVFTSGDILPGLTLSSIGANTSNPIVAVGTGTIPGATRAVGTDDPANSLDLSFNQGQSAVGLDLLLSAKPGDVGTGYVDVLVYSAQGLIDSQRILVSGIGTFLGLAESQAITRIDLTSESTGEFLFVDNVSFSPALDPTAVPEPASLALTALGLIGALGLARGPRRRE